MTETPRRITPEITTETGMLTARWLDARRAEIVLIENATLRIVPADPANADYRRLTRGDPDSGAGPVTIAEPDDGAPGV